MYWTLYYFFIFPIVTSVKVQLALMEPHYREFAIRTFRALKKINRQYCTISCWDNKVFETVKKIFVQYLNWYKISLNKFFQNNFNKYCQFREFYIII